MNRYIDADYAYKVLTEYYHQRTDVQHLALKEALDRVPTADVVEVVRCKECKWWDETTCSSTLTPDNRLCLANCCYWRADDFCSFGERREDA